jgi:glycosyltransferase involved in cell wall biosynthesis
MKVLLTAGIYPPDIGGPATFVPKLATFLENSGVECELISLKPPNFHPQETSYRLTLVNRFPLPIRFMICLVIIFIKTIKSDRIFSNGLYLESALALRVLQKKSVAKIVGDPIWERARNRRATELSLVEFQFSKLSFRNRVIRWAYKFALNSYSVIICPSEELVDVVTGWGVNCPVICIPNGVDIHGPTFQEKQFDLIYVGRLVKWKNVDSVIRISASKNLKTVIIGSGPLEAELKALSSSLGSKSLFLGELTSEKISMYLNQSKLFILLSQYEGLSFALLEAMSCGLPAIVSNAKGNTDVVTDSFNGLIVDMENPDSKIGELCLLLEDDSRYAIMSSRARETIANKYDSQKVLNQYMNLMVNLHE